MNVFVIALCILCSLAPLNAQKLNQEIKLENGQSFLVGPIDKNGLSSNEYQSWYEKNHNAYKVATETIMPVQDSLAKHKILVFMGTWCGDSKREVPRFLKVLEAANFPTDQLKIVGVDRRKDYYKKSPTGEEWALSIKRVPTFIFYKDGKEVNRIIESPITSLEADMQAIVTEKDYVPNYPTSLHFD